VCDSTWLSDRDVSVRADLQMFADIRRAKCSRLAEL
jgi:hypothetical protein